MLLDGSNAAEEIFSLDGLYPLLEQELAFDGELILFMVTAPAKPDPTDDNWALWSAHESVTRSEAMDYLYSIALRHGDGTDRWRCEVISYSSPIDGIVDFAEGEGVDLIALCSYDSDAPARLVKGYLAASLKRLTKIRVCVFGPN